jgi:alkanesulfonate monooxygenase SsuD/methylene tetrahydromethanopterin reductase-like flavin-dependent oxidoreductase (luciferase family)
VNAYYNSFTKRQELLCDHATNPNIALVSQFMCAETDEEAQRRADGSSFFQFCLRFYNTEGPVVPGTVQLWDKYEEWKASPSGQKQQGSGLIGSPETIRRKLRKFAESNVDQIILLNQAGRNEHAHICESLELFAAEVMPEFHALEPEHQKWKQSVLSGEIELEEIATGPYNPLSLQSTKWKQQAAVATAG